MPQIKSPVEPPPVIHPPEQSWTGAWIVTREEVAAAEREGRRRKKNRAAIITATVGGFAVITLVVAVLASAYKIGEQYKENPYLQIAQEFEQAAECVNDPIESSLRHGRVASLWPFPSGSQRCNELVMMGQLQIAIAKAGYGTEKTAANLQEVAALIREAAH